MAGELAEGGMLAAYYHADMDPAMREGVHLQWSQGMAPILIKQCCSDSLAFSNGVAKITTSACSRLVSCEIGL